MQNLSADTKTFLDQLKEWSNRYGIPFAHDVQSSTFVKNKIHIVPYSFAKTKHILPIEEENGRLVTAICNPFCLETIEELRSLSGKEIKEILVTKEALDDAIEKCYHQKEDVTSQLIATLPSDKQMGIAYDENVVEDLLDTSSNAPIIKLLNSILLEAIQQKASDVHFEPKEQGISIRYRIDGVLQTRHAPPKEYQSQLITRIKVLSRLDIAEQRLPQDGRIKLKIGGREIDLRVSTIPCVHGERIVLRILDKSNIVLGLTQLGMQKPIFEIFRTIISLSEGIVLVTGPTGSGKTTTLYSALASIHSSEVNVMTIEDPVEYKLEGMAQIAVNPKIHLDFATGLRHILRQDPDVIMIGEIRDRETAEIAIQASLTGHMVFSTLHTNDAPSALTRLVDMGIEPYLLTSSVVGILAQRLVRTLCPHCKIAYTPTVEESVALGLPADALLYRGGGCSSCYGSGYKGRRGIYELMVVTSSIKQQLLQSADAHQLQKKALEAGMIPLREDGKHLVKEGVTTFSELLRATKGCEEL